MSLSPVDIITRADALLGKYEKYTAPNLERNKRSKEDAFGLALDDLRALLDNLREKADANKDESNRALVATCNAEIRRSKAKVLETDVPKLQKLARKKGKGVTKEMVAERLEQVDDLASQIEAIPDGVSSTSARQASARKNKGKGKAGNVEIDVDALETQMRDNPAYMEHTEETQAFQDEVDAAKTRQDSQLDDISAGLSTLRTMADDMSEEIAKQNPLALDIEERMDNAESELKNKNKRLKSLVTSVRTSRNFCLDMVLICIVLGIGAYIYSLVK
ncbi:syntaxin of plants SYP7 [Pycnococcus provasolii]